MTLQYDEKSIVRHLNGLPEKLRPIVAVACAGRLVRLIVDADARPEPGIVILDGVVNLLWADAFEQRVDVSEIQSLLEQVMLQLPEEDDETRGESYDLVDDAVSAVAYAIRARLTGSSQESAWSARRCYEYADTLANRDLSDRGIDEPSEGMLLEHPHVQSELAHQQHVLERIVAFDGSAEKDWRKLRVELDEIGIR